MNYSFKNSYFVLSFVVLVVSSANAYGGYSYRKIVTTRPGDPRNFGFTNLESEPAVNSNGDVVFWAATPSGEKIYKISVSDPITGDYGSPEEVASGSGFTLLGPLGRLATPLINDQGDVAFLSGSLSSSPISAGGCGLPNARADGAGPLTRLAEKPEVIDESLPKEISPDEYRAPNSLKIDQIKAGLSKRVAESGTTICGAEKNVDGVIYKTRDTVVGITPPFSMTADGTIVYVATLNHELYRQEGGHWQNVGNVFGGTALLRADTAGVDVETKILMNSNWSMANVDDELANVGADQRSGSPAQLPTYRVLDVSGRPSVSPNGLIAIRPTIRNNATLQSGLGLFVLGDEAGRAYPVVFSEGLGGPLRLFNHRYAINDTGTIVYFGTKLNDQYGVFKSQYSGASTILNSMTPIVLGHPDGPLDGLGLGGTPEILPDYSMTANIRDTFLYPASTPASGFGVRSGILPDSANVGSLGTKVDGSNIGGALTGQRGLRRRGEIVFQTSLFDGSNGIYLAIPGPVVLFRDGPDKTIFDTGSLSLDFIPGVDHVGFLYNRDSTFEGSRVIESTRFNDKGTYYSPELGQLVPVAFDDGVQATMPLDVWMFNGTNGSIPSVYKTTEIAIPEPLGGKMKSYMMGDDVQATLYTPSIAFPLGLIIADPIYQKGPTRFSCVGLIERAAEEAGRILGPTEDAVLDGVSFKNGAGFLPEHLEFGVMLPSTVLFSMENRKKVFEAEAWFKLIADVNYLDEPFHKSSEPKPFFIQVIDPMGRIVGTTASGDMNQIPGAFFTGAGPIQEFLILNPIPGEYQILAVGNSQYGSEISIKAKSHSSEYSYDGLLVSGPIVSVPFQVDRVNHSPTAVINGGGTVPASDPIATVDGASSTDSDGDEISYSWSVVSHPSNGVAHIYDPQLANTQISFSGPGEYRIRLEVTDALGAVGTGEVVYLVSDDNAFFEAGLSKGVYNSTEIPELLVRAKTLPSGGNLEYFLEISLDHVPQDGDRISSKETKSFKSKKLLEAGRHEWSVRIFLQNRREAERIRVSILRLRTDIVSLQGVLDKEVNPDRRVQLEKEIDSKNKQIQVLLEELNSGRRSIQTINRGFWVQ